MHYRLMEVVESLIYSYLTPPPRVDIQDPCILQSVPTVIHSSSNQQLGVLLPIVETAGSMRVPPYWLRGSFGPLQFGPLLEQVTHYTQCHIMNSHNNTYSLQYPYYWDNSIHLQFIELFSEHTIDLKSMR